MTGDVCNTVVLYDGFTNEWLLFRRPREILLAHTAGSVQSCLGIIEEKTGREGLWAAGFMAYEAAPAFDTACAVHDTDDFPLLWFGIYDEPESVSLSSPKGDEHPEIPWKALLSRGEYGDSFHRIKTYIQKGHTYQVNYTFRLQAPFASDSWELFLRMIHSQQTTYGVYVDAGRWILCSASPELFFTLDGDELSCRPMKGTVPRGLTHTDDMAQAAWLGQSEKNRAENVMIVDMVRNDMGRIALTGTVEVADLFRLEQYPTLWQMTSTVVCSTDAGIADIFKALFPSASITGAPKVRTMEIIAELERTPRRIYTGTLGYCGPGRKAQFNVAIRTVLIDRERKIAEYGTGGGIVHDSEQGDELKECYTKARILTQAMPRFSLLETLLWTPSDGCLCIDGHLERLSRSTAYFSRPFSDEVLRNRLKDLVRTLSPVPHVLRLLIPPPPGEPVIEAHERRDLPAPWRVMLAKEPVDSRDLFLYHKTTFRGVYDNARAACPGYDDVLLWNEKGEVTESCIANVIVERDGRLLTPPVRCGLLAGIGRSRLLQDGMVGEEILTVGELGRCSRMFLVNSVRGLWEIWPEGIS